MNEILDLWFSDFQLSPNLTFCLHKTFWLLKLLLFTFYGFQNFRSRLLYIRIFSFISFELFVSTEEKARNNKMTENESQVVRAWRKNNFFFFFCSYGFLRSTSLSQLPSIDKVKNCSKICLASALIQKDRIAENICSGDRRNIIIVRKSLLSINTLGITYSEWQKQSIRNNLLGVAETLYPV